MSQLNNKSMSFEFCWLVSGINIVSYSLQVQGTKVTGSYAPVSALDFCFQTLSLAVGYECGQVSLFYVVLL